MTEAKQQIIEEPYIPLMPIWDSINDVCRVSAIVNLLAYLTSPQHLKEDDEFDIFHGVFLDIGERLDNATHELEEARKNVKIIRKESMQNGAK